MMEKDEIDIQSIIEKILWGKSIVNIDKKSFILRSLNIRESNICQHIYEQELKISIENGLMQHEELCQFYLDSGDWSIEYDEEIDTLDKEINNIKLQISRSMLMEKRKKSLEKILCNKTDRREYLLNLKYNLLSYSAESRAEEIKRRYMVMCCTEDMLEQPYWKTKEDFLNEDDHTLINNLAIKYYTNNLFDEKTLRKIARSGAWRFRWKMAKSGTDLFGRSISNWSEMQNLIVYWSQFYDYVYENPDRPDDNIVEDDALCDEWVKRQDSQNRIEKKGSDNKSNYNMFGTKKANMNKEHQEHFIMVPRDDKHAIEKVQGMNAPIVRRKLRQEHQIIKEKGKISEFQLRKGTLPNGEKIPITKKQV